MIFFLAAMIGTGYAQAPDTSWTKTYGTALREGAYDIDRTYDGNYIVTGEIETSQYNTDVYLLKISPEGDTLWTASFGDINTDEYGRSVRQTSDGGFIIAGYGGISQENEVILIKTDSLGNYEWESAFGPTADNRGHVVRETSDGGFIIAGQAWIIRGAFGSYDIYAIKTNAFGGLEWERFIGGEMNEFALGVCEAENGDFIAAGRTQTSGWDAYLVRLSASGDSLWARGLDETGQNDAIDILALPDGSGFMCTGIQYIPGQNGSNAFLTRVDNDGNIVWWQNYGGADEEYGESLAATADGGYVIGGMMSRYDIGWNVYVVKTDSLGNEEWTGNFGGTGDDRGHGIAYGYDGSIVIAGWTSSYGGGWLDVYLIKYEGSLTGIEDNEQERILPNKVRIDQNFPNPFNASTEITYFLPDDGPVTLEIFDLLGRKVNTLVDRHQLVGDHSICWDANEAPSGIYFYKIQTDNGNQIRKMVVLK